MASRMPWLARQATKAAGPCPGGKAFPCAPALWPVFPTDVQAAGVVLTGCPAALTGPLDRSQAPGWPGRDENDQVVADPFEVGDQVGGQHDAEALLGDRLHQALQELPPGERVQAGDRLVEDEQFGPLGHRQGEGEGSFQSRDDPRAAGTSGISGHESAPVAVSPLQRRSGPPG
jgi:hypothetical protein